jgi:hypothetical protein
MTSRAWYGIAVLVFVASAGCAAWILWSALGGIGDTVVRVVVPGVVTLDLDEPGSYTIFHESRSVIDGVLYTSENVNGLRVTLRAEGSGKPVTIARPTMSSRYSISGHEGVSILSFDIAEPGRYRLSAAYDDAAGRGRTVLAIEHGFVARLLRTIAATIATGLFGLIAAVVIAAITFARRRRLRRQAVLQSGPATRP